MYYSRQQLRKPFNRIVPQTSGEPANAYFKGYGTPHFYKYININLDIFDVGNQDYFDGSMHFYIFVNYF